MHAVQGMLNQLQPHQLHLILQYQYTRHANEGVVRPCVFGGEGGGEGKGGQAHNSCGQQGRPSGWFCQHPRHLPELSRCPAHSQLSLLHYSSRYQAANFRCVRCVDAQVRNMQAQARQPNPQTRISAALQYHRDVHCILSSCPRGARHEAESMGMGQFSRFINCAGTSRPDHSELRRTTSTS